MKVRASSSPLKAILKYSLIPLLIAVLGFYMNDPYLIGAAVVVFLLIHLVSHFYYSHYYLLADDRAVEWHKGILNQASRTISWENVDNITIERSFLDRILGLCVVKIDSAGSRGIEIVAENIPYKKAMEVYNIYREKMKEIKD